MTIGQFRIEALRILKGPYGYSQGSGAKDGRWSGLSHSPGNFDCSSFSGSVAYLSGFLTKRDITGTFYSGNVIRRLVDSGMYYAVDVNSRSLASLRKYLQAGDILQGKGHVVVGLGAGMIGSFESDERGRSSGGRVGDQTGREGMAKALYPRSRGWSKIARPYSFEHFLGRAIAEYGSGILNPRTMERMTRRSPWDGPRYQTFLKDWKLLDQGMQLRFDPATMPAPGEGHWFVVLGSGLSSKGALTTKYRRRLELVKRALDKFPRSKVLISGGAPKSGVTEAAAGWNFLVNAGIEERRISVETKSASTVGNAKYSIPILLKLGAASYTLVSDASHLRRAQIEFLAMQAKLETASNKLLPLKHAQPLAFNDYGNKPVSTMRPVTKATRAAIAREVAFLLGVSAQYKAAL